MELTNLKNIVTVYHKKKPYTDYRYRALVVIFLKNLLFKPVSTAFHSFKEFFNLVFGMK